MQPPLGSQKDIEFQHKGSKFRFTPTELSAKVAGSDAPVVFDYEQKDANLDLWGGIEGIAQGLGTNATVGLSEEDSQDLQERKEHFGSNEYRTTPPVTYCELIFEGMSDVTLIILMVAAAVSIGLGMYTDGVKNGWHEGAAILFAVAIVLNVTAINDLQKDKQFRELEKKNAQSLIKVLRDGKPKELMVDFIQVGDIILLNAGDMAPADCLYMTGTNTEMDESSMTGEPDMVKKNAKHPFIISGTTMSSGFATVLVIGVGPNCVQGRMREALNTETEATPLQLKLEKLATQISKLGTTIAAVCFISMFITHMVYYNEGLGTVDSAGKKKWTSANYQDLLNYFIVAVTVLVVAIPEGLPLAVAISLAYSMKKMQNDNILVRHLEACETMGGATTICTDKTGTLTQNKMTVMQAWVETGMDADQKAHFLSVFKEGHEQEYIDFITNVKTLPKVKQDILKKNSALNANADLVIDSNGMQKVSGSKTEGALLFFCEKLGGSVHEYRKSAKIVQSFPFTSERKRSSVLTWTSPQHEEFPPNDHPSPNKKTLRLYVKGASEMVLRLCTHMLDGSGDKVPLTGDFDMKSSGEVTGEGKKAFIAAHIINTMANEALRTIVLAYRDFEVDGNLDEESKDENFVDWINKTVTYRDEEKKRCRSLPRT
jgi:Ca2+-transporting ATPase